MSFNRACGILLHPTSLPSKYGIGDFGREAYEFLDFLHRSKQSLWQILPLNPVGYGESPFQSYSAFAGNPLLISIDGLIEQELLLEAEVLPLPDFDPRKVQFDLVGQFKNGLYQKAFARFKAVSIKDQNYLNFAGNTPWLKDYALFMALKDYFHGAVWNNWPVSIACREPEAIAYYENLLAAEIAYHSFLQYVFFSQWSALKAYAQRRGIKIIGDLPIFIACDSSDTWVNPCLFELDEKGHPTKVAGVPPDYFSATGQLWGNPHYRWTEMAKDDYYWWRERFRSLLELVDIIRIDHFRGFESYWEIPAGAVTAVEGKWVKGPGEKLFSTLGKYLGRIPVIAEDLGVITPAVEELKNKFHFPGMKILQFNLNYQEKEEFLPENYEANSVVYTGTHDNDTTVGWYRETLLNDPKQHRFIMDYLDLTPAADASTVCWRMIETAYRCRSNTAVIPLQDVLGLGSESRMNYPGTVGGNWAWRFPPDGLTPELAGKLRQLAEHYHR